MNPMKSKEFLLVAIWISGFLIGPILHGESRTRFSLLRVPAAATSVVRIELGDPAKGERLETMDALVKQGKIEMISDFTQVNPWISEPIELEKAISGVKVGEEELELGAKLKFEGDGKPEVSYSVEVTLPTGGKSACFFQVIGGSTIRRPAAWHERCCWVDGKDCLMLWEYPVSETDAEEKAASKIPAVQIEMRWFQASESDLSKLAASKPETREKALQWLMGRAKLWREAGYGFKLGNPSVWQMTQGKHDPERGESISDESFTLQTQCREEAGKLKMSWMTSVQKKGEEKSSSLSAEMMPGVWEFLPLEGNPEANVIACRVTKP